MMKTTELLVGDNVRLVSFGNTDPAYRRRLLSLGVTQGVTVRVIRSAPLGCPLQLEVRGTWLSVRKDESSELIWERI